LWHVRIPAPMTPPFHADHIGSLLRPKKLREAFRQHSVGQIPEDAFRAVQDAAIRDAVKLQEDCGLQVVTDGEFRRISYWEKFVRLTAGLVVKDAVFKFHDEQGNQSEFTAPYVEGKVGRKVPITLDEFVFLRKSTPRTGKITMPAPSTMHFYRFTHWGDPAVYRDAEQFFAELGRVYQAEIGDLAAAGCRYVQLDEVAVAILCDSAARRKEKGVVLGLVSSKTPQLENINSLRQRTDEAAKYIDAARLAISPQCGFASTMGGNPLTEADERAKLRLCVDAANAIWG